METALEVDTLPLKTKPTEAIAELTHQELQIKDLSESLTDPVAFCEKIGKLPPGVQYEVVRQIAQSDVFIYPDGKPDTNFGVYGTDYDVIFTGEAKYGNAPPEIRNSYEKVKAGLKLQGENLNATADGHGFPLPTGYTTEMIEKYISPNTPDQPTKIDPFLFVALNLRKIQASIGLSNASNEQMEGFTPLTNRQIAKRLEGMARRKGFQFFSEGPGIEEILECGVVAKKASEWKRRVR